MSGKSIEILFSILSKELGPSKAIPTVSDIVYNILDELEYNHLEVSESNIERLLEEKAETYKEAVRNRVA